MKCELKGFNRILQTYILEKFHHPNIYQQTIQFTPKPYHSSPISSSFRQKVESRVNILIDFTEQTRPNQKQRRE